MTTKVMRSIDDAQADFATLSAAEVGADASGAATAAQSAAATDATTKANAAQAAAIAASQPVDSDLTAIAALTTTSYGRAFLALADAAAARTALALGTAATHATGDYDAAGAATTAVAAEVTARDAAIAAAVAALINSAPGVLDTLEEIADALGDDPNFAATMTTALAGKQPLDSDLTSLAALTTTPYGRSVLETANAAALRTLAGLGTAAVAATGDFDASGAAAAAQAASWPATTAFDATAPTTSVVGDAAAAGSAAKAAHRDHTHGREAFGTTAAAVGTSAGGSATTPSKSDHVHATGAGTPSTQAFGDSAATGSGPAAAMTDHKHAMMALPAIDATGAATDITTRDASTSAHGLLPKLPNDATKLLNGLGAWTQTGWTVVTKASDESVSSSTTLQNDDELFFTASAGGKYEVEIVVLCTNAAGFTEDIKFAFGEDGTTRGHFMGVVPNAGDTTGVAAVGANQTGAIPCGLGTDIKIFKFSGTFYGNGGTFRVLWAQNTSGSNASTVKAGSLLRYRRVL